MGKEKFVYNTQTLRYEKVEEPLKIKILRVFGFVSAVVLAAFIIISIAYSHFPSPKEKALMREIEQMELKYASLNKDVDMLSKVLENVQERDASIHRLVFGMAPIDKDIWNGGVGGHQKFSDLTNFRNSGELLMSTQEKVAKIKRQLVIQSTSLDHGYGKNVTIDHGFGYKTLYAHMHQIDVKRGQKIKRGQTIGTVGSTGTSTAPHLHYEVIYKGKKVNPIHYCMDGLSPQEYQDLANMASITNQSLD